MARFAGSAAAAVILFSVASAHADPKASAAAVQDPQPSAPPSAAAYVSAYSQPPPLVYYRGTDGYGLDGMGPRTLDWNEGDQVPAGYHLGTQVRKGLVIGGSVTFGTIYMLSVAAAAFGGARQLLIPVAGPFAAIGENHATDGAAAALVLNGALQAGGVAMLVAGIVAPKTVLIRNDIGRGFVMPTPMTFGANSGGIGCVGTF